MVFIADIVSFILSKKINKIDTDGIKGGLIAKEKALKNFMGH